jgi:hypothetical protein
VKRIKNWLIVKAAILFALVALNFLDVLGSFTMPLVYLTAAIVIGLVVFCVVNGASENEAHSGTESFIFDRMAVPVMLAGSVVADDPEDDNGSRVRAMCGGCHRNPSEMTITTGSGDVLELCTRCAGVGKTRVRGRN